MTCISRVTKHYSCIKNTINKDPGVNHYMLTWLYTECECTGTPKHGGLIFDEMNIQPNVQFGPHWEGLRMFGLVGLGEQERGINNILREEKGLNMGTSIIQFVFLALNPFAIPPCLYREQWDNSWRNCFPILASSEYDENIWIQYFIRLYGWGINKPSIS